MQVDEVVNNVLSKTMLDALSTPVEDLNSNTVVTTQVMVSAPISQPVVSLPSAPVYCLPLKNQFQHQSPSRYLLLQYCLPLRYQSQHRSLSRYLLLQYCLPLRYQSQLPAATHCSSTACHSGTSLNTNLPAATLCSSITNLPDVCHTTC